MRLPPICSLPASLLLLACAGSPSEGPTAAQREDVVARSAVVESVDLDTRQVLLRTDEDRMVSLVAPEDVRNLAQLEPGDRIDVVYREAVAVEMADPSMAAVSGGALAERAPEGAKPGAAVDATLTTVVEFVSYDPASATATFVTPDGFTRSAVVRPELRDFAAARRPGERVAVRVDRAVALSIDERGG